MDKEDVVWIYIWVCVYYSAIKKNEIVPFTEMWMDLEIVMHSEIIRMRKANIVYWLSVESRETVQMNMFAFRVTDTENTFGYQGRRGVEWVRRLWLTDALEHV